MKIINSILFIVSDIHLNGGGERVTINMANYYAEYGYNVTILSFGPKKSSEIFAHSASVEIKYLDIKNTKYISKWRACNSFKDFISIQHFDIIFGIGTYPNVVVGLVRRLHGRIFNNTKIIGCEHLSFDAANIIWKNLRRLSYPYLNATVVLTKTDLPKILKLNKNSFVIPNTVKLLDIKSDLKAKRFLGIGRLSREKRFDLMIKMFAEFSKIQKDWHLDIVGQGPELESLNNLIKQLMIADSVTIHPFSHNISSYYLRSSIFLMTSQTEGLPMVLLEAKSFGLPIISFDCDTGPRDIIVNGEDGYLIPMDNEGEFLNAMINLTSRPELLNSMGYKSRLNASNFSPTKIFGMWNELINNL